MDEMHFADTEPAWEDMDPLQRAAFEASIEDVEYARAEDFCSHCGKEMSDFSDLGCEHCDRRHPDFGTMPLPANEQPK